MRIEVMQKSKGAVNLTNGKVREWVPVYTGTNGGQTLYHLRNYIRGYALNINITLEIKRK